jgi:hypothetical protein
MKKGLFIIVILIVVFWVVACSQKLPSSIVDVETVNSILMNNSNQELPEIKLVKENGEKIAAKYSDFWFNAEYVYVQNGKVYPKPTAPYIFEDVLQITYRYDKNIKTTLHIVKQYIPLDGITLSTANNATTCKQGESVQFNVAYYPNNAGDKDVIYQIIQGVEFAQIDGTGLLTVNELAAVGEEIKVKAIVNHINLPMGITDEIDESNIITVIISKSYDVIVADNTVYSIYVPEKDNFIFYGYYTDKNGTGVQYFDYEGNIVNKINTEIKLYAYWVALTQKITLREGKPGIGYEIGERQRDNWKKVAVEFEKLTTLGYTKANILWQISNAETDRDTEARYILDYGSDTDSDNEGNYINENFNIGGTNYWYVSELYCQIPIEILILYPYIRGVYEASYREEWIDGIFNIGQKHYATFYIDWSAVTITVTK